MNGVLIPYIFLNSVWLVREDRSHFFIVFFSGAI